MTDEYPSPSAQPGINQARLLQAQYLTRLGDFTWDMATGQVTWSDGMYRLLKYDPQEKIDINTVNVSIHHPDDLAKVTTWVQKGIAAGAECLTPNEYRLICRDGEVITVQTNVRIEYRQGQPVTLFGTCQDITQKKQAEDNLKRYQQIVSITRDLMALVDQNYHYQLVNEAYSRAFDSHPEEIVGTTVEILLGSDHFHGVVKDKLDRCLQGEVVTYQTWLTLPVLGTRCWDIRYVPYVTHQGQIEGVLISKRDITDFKHVENHLRTSQALYESLVDSLPMSLYRVNLAGQVTFANRALLQSLGLSADEVLGKTAYDFYPQDLANKYRRDDALVTTQNRTLHITEENINPHTSRMNYVEVIKIPIHGPDGQIEGLQGIFWDITERKQTEIALRKREKLWRSLTQNSPDYIMLLNHRYEIVFVNHTLPGVQAEDILGVALPNLAPESSQHIETVLGRVLQTGVPERYETLFTDPDGVRRCFESRVAAISDSLKDEVLLVTSTDITPQKNHQQQLEYIAHYDSLTDLPNRILLAKHLQEAMHQTQQQGYNLAVTYLDLDGFKAINDTYGHEIGDQVLTTLADRMRHTLRQSDILARLGGDEFVAILPALPKVATCLPILARLLDVAAQPVQVGDLELQVTASLGVTFFPQSEAVDADQLLRQADQAMYQAKLSGKNRYHTFDTEQARTLRTYHESLEDIRQGLENQEFVLYYQPQVNIRTGQLVGAEALIRWQHPQRGLLFPADFLGVIANQPVAIDLCDWIIDNALHQLAFWHQAGLSLSISVNVDAYHLQQPNFVDRLHEFLAAHPTIKASWLKLEILETSALEDITQISRVMQACQDIGVRFALDDFGTGYSSLTHLKHLPADQLKIDKSFVHDMLEDPFDLAILKGVLGLADAFQREVIAEGVETPAHIERLLELGCELAQGYVIARPMPAEDFLNWAKRDRPHGFKAMG
jgi:diguanylate cyclase (GGDEF)-like protein/PAS domain S-box-containing protein